MKVKIFWPLAVSAPGTAIDTSAAMAEKATRRIGQMRLDVSRDVSSVVALTSVLDGLAAGAPFGDAIGNLVGGETTLP